MLAAQLLPHPLWEAPAIVVARTFRIPYYCIRTVAYMYPLHDVKVESILKVIRERIQIEFAFLCKLRYRRCQK